MCRIALLLLLPILTALPVASGEQWFWGEGEVSMAQYGWEEAQEKALERARKDALEKASGVEVRAGELAMQIERSDMAGVVDVFSSIIHSQSRGRIVEQADIAYESVGGTPPACKARGRFRIVSETAEPDPGFALHLDVNGRTAAASVRDGEKFVIGIRATKDCYVTILNLFSNDSLAVVYPNSLLQDNFVRANTYYSIFPESLSAVASFRANISAGKAQDIEYLIAVATTRGLALPCDYGPEETLGDLKHFSDALANINTWLLEIPPNERTDTSLMLRVFR